VTSQLPMIKFNISGLGDYNLEHLVMDVNGTLAIDGQLIDEGTAPAKVSRSATERENYE
jgi:hypothetical protein